MATTYCIYIGENKLLDILLKDANGEGLDISALTFLEAKIIQPGVLVERIQLFPDVDDDRISYSGSVLTVEVSKTISRRFKPGIAVYVRLRMNNPDVDFSDGEEHIDIDEFQVFTVKP